MAAAGSLEVPKMTEKHDERNFVKSSARFRNILAAHGMPKNAPEALRIHHSKVLPSPFNRLGNPLNVMYIHHELAANIKKDGYRTGRPTAGLVIKRTGAKLKRLHDTAKKLISQHSNLLPPINVDESANRECLGGNHLTVALRMYDCSYTSPLTGMKCEILNDEELQNVCKNGHVYLELDELVSDEDCKFLSELMNSDQNQNQCHSEDHLRLQIQEVLHSLITPARPSVPVSSIVSKVCELSVVKMRPDHVGDAAQYVTSLFGSPYVQQLSRWYATNVNPRQLSISARWMADITRLWGSTRGLCKLGATLLHYRGLTVTPGTAPNPDTSRTVEVPLMTLIGTQYAANLDACEAVLRETRAKFEKYTVEKLGAEVGIDVFLIFEEASLRLLLGKSLAMADLAHGVSGKWSVEKQLELQKAWLKAISLKHPELGPMAADMQIDTDEKIEVHMMFACMCVCVCQTPSVAYT